MSEEWDVYWSFSSSGLAFSRIFLCDELRKSSTRLAIFGKSFAGMTKVFAPCFNVIVFLHVSVYPGNYYFGKRFNCDFTELHNDGDSPDLDNFMQSETKPALRRSFSFAHKLRNI